MHDDGTLPWCKEFDFYREYHDTEWGLPLRDDRALFELLILEGAQADLSWATVLKKRAHYRRVFDGFDPHKIACYDDQKVAALLADPGIIRNRAKIAAILQNAMAYFALTAGGNRSAISCGLSSAAPRCKTPGHRWPKSPPKPRNRMR